MAEMNRCTPMHETNHLILNNRGFMSCIAACNTNICQPSVRFANGTRDLPKSSVATSFTSPHTAILTRFMLLCSYQAGIRQAILNATPTNYFTALACLAATAASSTRTTNPQGPQGFVRPCINSNIHCPPLQTRAACNQANDACIDTVLMML